jgi:hypothetical protein
MDWKLELVAIPVSEVGRAKDFYVDQAGFVADVDLEVGDGMRFVLLHHAQPRVRRMGERAALASSDGSPRCASVQECLLTRLVTQSARRPWPRPSGVCRSCGPE